MDGQSAIQRAQQQARGAATQRKSSGSSNQQVKLKGKGMRDSVIQGDAIQSGYLKKKSRGMMKSMQKRYRSPWSVLVLNGDIDWQIFRGEGSLFGVLVK
jgi:hypothetical protein